MAENMVLGGIDPIVTALYGVRSGNKIIPKNDVAKQIVEAKPDKPGTIQDAILRRKKKKLSS